MPDYYYGKIYKIVCNTTGRLYVGSTTRDLQTRLAAHISSARAAMQQINDVKRGKITSCVIINEGDYYIELLESYPCYRKHQLLDREAYYIRRYRTLGLPIVNRNIPGRTIREYCEDNKAERAARDRQFRATHPDYYKNYRATQPYRDECKRLRAVGGGE